MTKTRHPPLPPLRGLTPAGPVRVLALGLALMAAGPLSALANSDGKAVGKAMGDQVREVLEGGALTQKRLTLIVNGKAVAVMPAGEKAVPQNEAHSAAKPARTARPPANTSPASGAGAPATTSSRQYIKAKAAELSGHELPTADPASGHHDKDSGHWSYAGPSGPKAWSQLHPDFGTCASGERQSPINIDEAVTLKGPAEALQFKYQPSHASVVNNGHTIQVDVLGENDLTVRNTTYKLVQFHFHHPSEERVNYRSYAMVAHLVHKNNEGQLAVVAVLLDPGLENALINKVWTHMPLDVDDRVRLPDGLIDLNELLPQDQRYYQFMGSLTTPPCTEGVLWMVLKQPTPLSAAQLRLFSQLFPNNARPVQPLNGRPVRDAQ